MGGILDLVRCGHPVLMLFTDVPVPVDRFLKPATRRSDPPRRLVRLFHVEGEVRAVLMHVPQRPPGAEVPEVVVRLTDAVVDIVGGGDGVAVLVAEPGELQVVAIPRVGDRLHPPRVRSFACPGSSPARTRHGLPGNGEWRRRAHPTAPDPPRHHARERRPGRCGRGHGTGRRCRADRDGPWTRRRCSCLLYGRHRCGPGRPTVSPRRRSRRTAGSTGPHRHVRRTRTRRMRGGSHGGERRS